MTANRVVVVNDFVTPRTEFGRVSERDATTIAANRATSSQRTLRTDEPLLRLVTVPPHCEAKLARHVHLDDIRSAAVPDRCCERLLIDFTQVTWLPMAWRKDPSRAAGTRPLDRPHVSQCPSQAGFGRNDTYRQGTATTSRWGRRSTQTGQPPKVSELAPKLSELAKKRTP